MLPFTECVDNCNKCNKDGCTACDARYYIAADGNCTGEVSCHKYTIVTYICRAIIISIYLKRDIQ